MMKYVNNDGTETAELTTPRDAYCEYCLDLEHHDIVVERGNGINWCINCWKRCKADDYAFPKIPEDLLKKAENASKEAKIQYHLQTLVDLGYTQEVKKLELKELGHKCPICKTVHELETVAKHCEFTCKNLCKHDDAFYSVNYVFYPDPIDTTIPYHKRTHEVIAYTIKRECTSCGSEVGTADISSSKLQLAIKKLYQEITGDYSGEE